MNDAIAGHVDLLVGSTALSVPQIQAGALRAVAQTGKARTAALGAVPTVAEGGFAGFEAYAWWGVFAPAGTPKATIARFGNELAAILREPRVEKQLSETQQARSCSADRNRSRRSCASRCRPGARSHANSTSRATDFVS
jgi:tripartite-type tricarboxylate transporter receptor subunit TctC